MNNIAMKLSAVVAAGILGVILLVPSRATAVETTVAGTTISVTASVSGVVNLSTQPKNITDNSNAAGLTFTTVTSKPAAWSNRSLQYVQISVDDNAISWRLRTYSNNFSTYTNKPNSISTTTWGFAYGGMVSGTQGAKVSMAWLANVTLLTPTVGNPALGTTNGWTYLKDFNDVDDPNTNPAIESFPVADSQGYTNIAFGSPAFTRVVDPRASGSSNSLTATNDSWFLYFEGDFNSSPAASYSTNLVLELLNQ